MKSSREMLITLRRFNQMLKKRERSLIFISMIIRILLVGFDIVGLALLGVTASLLSGSVISGSSWTGKAIGALETFGITNVYALFGVTSVCFFVAKSFLAITLNSWVLTSVAKMEASKASELFASLLGGDLKSKEHWTEAELAHGVMGAMDMAFSKALLAVSIVIGEMALILGILVFLGFQNLMALTTVAAYFALIGWLMNLLISRRNKIATKKITDANMSITNLVHETIGNFRQVAPSGRRKFFTSKFEFDRNSISLESSRISVIGGLPRYITEIALMLSLGALLLQRAFASELLDTQTIGIFVAGSFRIIASMLPLQAAISLLGQVNISGKTAFEMSEFLPTNMPVANFPNPSSLKNAEYPSVILNDVEFTFSLTDETATILRGINLEVQFGEFISLTGKSGQGKSTVADLILGLREPTRGKVVIDGLDAASIRLLGTGLVGYVPQRGHIFRGTISENISCEIDTERNESLVDDLIDRCQLRELVNSLEHGSGTQIGQGMRPLSGGQIQRINLARALYQQPKILVLDEATNALDAESERAIVQMLEGLKGKITVLAITHSGPLKLICDRSFRLEDGKLHQENL